MQVVAAPLTGIRPLRLDTIPIGRPLTGRAFVALPEPDVEQVLQAGLVIRELREELADGLRLAHTASYTPYVLRMSGG